MRKNILVIGLLLVASFFALPCVNYAFDDLDDEIIIYMGQTKEISTTNLNKVVVGNPTIIDVSNVNKSGLTLVPKTPGSTTFAFIDSYGEKSCQVKVYAEDMSDIKRRIDVALSSLGLPNVTTKADDEENRIIILGNVKNAGERERINTLLGPLKAKVVDMLEIKEQEETVEIDVQVLELDKGSSDSLGFTWPGAVNILETGSPGLAAAGTQWGTLFKLLNVQRGTSSAGADPYTLRLDFLIQEGKARVLSRPRLTCQSGKEAKLLVGGEVPIFTATVSSTGVTTGTVDYKEYGIILNMRPIVEEDKRIHLNMNVEVSELGVVESTAYAKAYPLIKRSTSTELFMADGQTLAISGLIKQKSSEDLRKVPWLSDIPVLGAFFRNKISSTGGGYSARGDTELFITLTPKLISKKLDSTPEDKAFKRERAPSPSVIGDVNPIVADYARIIQKRVMENVSYPNAAKEAGFEGITKLSMHLSHRGELLDATVKSSSGYSVLDESALAAAKATAMYPPFSSSIKQEDLWLDIPISYKL